MYDIAYIFEDPREGIDSNLWIKLFSSFRYLEDREKAFELHKLLWGFRALGAELKITREGIKILPIIETNGIWSDEKEFEENKQKFLRPFVTEVKYLFDKVMAA